MRMYMHGYMRCASACRVVTRGGGKVIVSGCTFVGNEVGARGQGSDVHARGGANDPDGCRFVTCVAGEWCSLCVHDRQDLTYVHHAENSVVLVVRHLELI